ncbi:DNA cytosine methyltransferase [Neorhizobium sp. JUb45]|uniref:DNA cytosine methyltransferase n=1 Tax=Neorhizobium sp. JUb45 TaxID=2485113 RepID=UPI0010479BAF|nr:DNA cytosine methyltransferase [Neorhizobium sp. JUb45]TCQ99023.1 DNA (cytosine-5)-methyltransferase 1 [Neorhizobium sp. JUb45]
MAKLRVLDLFCGCGGLSFGISDARYQDLEFEVVAGLDFNRSSIETFKLNHPNAKTYCVDIRKANIDEIIAEIGHIDVVVGGPSCQGFSTHGKRLADDPRNFLYKSYLEFIAKIKPTWSLMENVTGLLRYGGGRFRDEIIKDLSSMGYKVSFAQLQAADYGVPQVRKRIFFVANKIGVPFEFPAPSHFPPDVVANDHTGKMLAYTSLTDAIGDLPMIGIGVTADHSPKHYALPPVTPFQQWSRRSAGALSLHFGAPPPRENLERIRHIPSGGDWLDIPADLLPSRFAKILRKDCTTLYYRLRWDRPGYTITTVYRNVSSGAFTHPDEDRALTHREAARIQSFPDHFQFHPSGIASQIGNAVPPLLARVLGISMLAHVDMSRKQLRMELEDIEPVVSAAVRENALSSTAKESIKSLKNSINTLQSAHDNKMPWKRGKIAHGSQFNLARTERLWDHLLADCAGLNETQLKQAIFDCSRLAMWAGNDGADVSGRYVRTSSALDKIPQRRRPNNWTAHHFATVRYAIDPDTGSTDVNRPLFLSHKKKA